MDIILYVQLEGWSDDSSSSHTHRRGLARHPAGISGLLFATAFILPVLLAASTLPAFAAPVARSTAHTTPTSSEQPLSASGCNQSVCIYITGSGTDITNWSTSATLPTSMCTIANYWANGNLVNQGNEKCGDAGASVYSYWPQPGYFGPGTQLCSTWTGVAGRPCETVE